ncbi:MAG TPA: diaminopimelate decarboxylase [Spirochaetota bacterium]|nr:diaminopimelate decarboxylase [Spirochaetota bacterium]
MEQLLFLRREQVRRAAELYGTPLYIYSEKILKETAKRSLAFPAPFGLTVRYAMKSNPLRQLLQLFYREGIEIDASSGYEAVRAIRAGIKPEHILLTGQELPADFKKLVRKGVLFNATSLRQLESYGSNFPGTAVSIRINPGLGSGGTQRTNVGGPAASFGIWHADLDRAAELIKKYNLKVLRIHSHIGSGSDPAVWLKAAELTLQHMDCFPEVGILNLGGGFKTARMSYEKSTDLQEIGNRIKKSLLDYHAARGRKLHLEIEPGTFLTARAGSLVTTIHDVNNTGADGYRFLKVDAGMTDLLRPAMYGAQHPLVVVPRSKADKKNTLNYIVSGHCCESGDILTPAENDPEALKPRPLQQADAGDFLVVEGCGAYTASMCARNYNSFPAAAAVLLRENGKFKRVCKREKLGQIVQNEC